MSDFLLTQIINYGAPAFAVLLFLGALGFPVGASVLVIAAGAFSQQGILNWLPTAVLGLIGCMLGDALSFGIGFYAKHWLDQRFGKSPVWRHAQKSFEARAGLQRRGLRRRTPAAVKFRIVLKCLRPRGSRSGGGGSARRTPAP